MPTLVTLYYLHHVGGSFIIIGLQDYSDHLLTTSTLSLVTIIEQHLNSQAEGADDEDAQEEGPRMQ